MKKLVTILVLLCLSLIICQAQDLSVIRNGENYLLVKSQKSQQTKVDSTQLKKLTIITISTEFIPISTIKTGVKNLAILNRLIVNNYDLIKGGNILTTDSVINKYNITKFWLKERSRRTYVVKEENDLIDCKMPRNSKSIIFNFEFILLLLSLIFIIYLDFSELKIKKHFENIVIISFFAALLISYPYVGLIANIVVSLIMTGVLLMLVLPALIHVKTPTRMSMIITYSVLSGFIQHDVIFSAATFAIGCFTIVVCWLIKSKNTQKITLNAVPK
ncbi:MAG: hypothetical protein WAW11_05005 [Patescibacteria group bacterium]